MKHDTEYTDQPICPYCGHQVRDAWEIGFGPTCEGETDIECCDCGREFTVSRRCTITYSTYPKTT